MRASWESRDRGLWLRGAEEAGAAGEVRSKERSALPRLALRLLSSFSCASAANCSKYLYLSSLACLCSSLLSKYSRLNLFLSSRSILCNLSSLSCRRLSLSAASDSWCCLKDDVRRPLGDDLSSLVSCGGETDDVGVLGMLAPDAGLGEWLELLLKLLYLKCAGV